MPFRYFIIIGLLLYIAYTMKKNEDRQKELGRKLNDFKDWATSD